nr:PREDICTED: F-box protein At5g49610-like [Daucus carota subsp. sativus]
MSLSKHKHTPSYDFPEELLSEIFKRLPVKYVLRCGAVQKSWYHLIRTPLFISIHSNYQKLTAHVNPKYLLFHDTSITQVKVRLDDAQCNEYCKFEYPLDLPTCLWNLQSNGLICLSNMFNENVGYNPDIYLWNPLVQKFRNVPDSPFSMFTFRETKWNALAFGFLPEVNDYVVVHVIKPISTAAPPCYLISNPDIGYEEYPHSVKIGVYSLNSNSWKEVCQDKVFVDYMSTDVSVFVDGTAFWVGYNNEDLCQLVMYFDTKTNVLGQVILPDDIIFRACQLENPLILPFGQSIAYFVEVGEDDASEDDEDYGSPHMDIWVLNKDTMGEFSWEEKMSVTLSENVWPEVLGIRNNGEPIQAKLDKLISYDLDTHEPYVFVESCEHLTPTPYYKEGSKSPFVIRPFLETLLFLDMD